MGSMNHERNNRKEVCAHGTHEYHETDILFPQVKVYLYSLLFFFYQMLLFAITCDLFKTDIRVSKVVPLQLSSI